MVSTISCEISHLQHVPKYDDQPPINTMNDLSLFLISKLLVLVGVVDRLSLAFVQILAFRSFDLQVRTCFGINVRHVVGELREVTRGGSGRRALLHTRYALYDRIGRSGRGLHTM
jgi:hypothetical protein